MIRSFIPPAVVIPNKYVNNGIFFIRMSLQITSTNNKSFLFSNIQDIYDPITLVHSQCNKAPMVTMIITARHHICHGLDKLPQEISSKTIFIRLE